MPKPDLTQFFLRVFACSYEGSLFGWSIQENEDQSGLKADLSFGFNCTSSSLKCLAVSNSGKYMVVGGADERVRIYNLWDSKATGEITTHTGAITALQFYEDSFLLSASEVNKFVCGNTLFNINQRYRHH